MPQFPHVQKENNSTDLPHKEVGRIHSCLEQTESSVIGSGYKYPINSSCSTPVPTAAPPSRALLPRVLGSNVNG